MKTITYYPAAEKALNRMSPDARDRVEARIEVYALTGHGDIKAMKSRPALRLRVGDYRVILTETLEVIDILDIGTRGDIYK